MDQSSVEDGDAQGHGPNDKLQVSWSHKTHTSTESHTNNSKTRQVRERQEIPGPVHQKDQIF